MPRDKRDIALLEARTHQIRALKEKIERLKCDIETRDDDLEHFKAEVERLREALKSKAELAARYHARLMKMEGSQ